MYIQKPAKCKVALAYQKYKKRWKSKNIKKKLKKKKKKNSNYKEEES